MLVICKDDLTDAELAQIDRYIVKRKTSRKRISNLALGLIGLTAIRQSNFFTKVFRFDVAQKGKTIDKEVEEVPLWDWNQNLEKLLFLLKKAPEKSRLQNDVVATIAALAATETKGVAYLSGSLTHCMSYAKHSSQESFQGCCGHSRRKKCVCTDFTYYRVWMQRTGCNSKGTGAR